jgi:hypothetical protein
LFAVEKFNRLSANAGCSKRINGFTAEVKYFCITFVTAET